MKVVNINDDYDIWLAVNECGIAYQIRVYYEYEEFHVTELSPFTLHKSDCYRYNEFGDIRILL